MKKKNEKKGAYLTIAELAEILGISRIAVYKRVKKGQIKAIRIGRSYAIPRENISGIIGEKLSKKGKEEIDRAVKKTVREYGKVLKMLGRE